MMYKVYGHLEQSDFLSLQNICELRRAQIQTINALSYENERYIVLAGYMLTGNRSMFVEIMTVLGAFMTEKLCLSILYAPKISIS